MSIVVLSFDNQQLLGECLTSIARTVDANATPYEVIVLFQQTGEEGTRSFLERFAGIKPKHVALNLGFGAGNNYAARDAKGTFLAFVNDDTTMQDGWLSQLTRTAMSGSSIGAVGSRILFPDGTLQEAGAIVWSDGSCYPLGRGEPAGSLAYTYLRDVDHTSANGLLVRRSSFEEVGGFDEQFFPGYYEDVDLCFKIRNNLRQRVLYQPRAVIFHHESVTSKRDPELRSFLFQRHQARFVAKWQSVLPRHTPAQPDSARAVNSAVLRARRCRKRVLVVDDRVPTAGMGSGFGRTADLLVDLSEAGYAVSFAATDRGHNPRENYFSEFGVDIISEGLSAHLARAYCSYDAIIVSRPHNIQAHYADLRRALPESALIYDVEALYHRRLLLQARMRQDVRERDDLYARADEMESLESFITRSADHLVSISDSEVEWLKSIDGHAPVTFMRPLARSISMTPANLGTRIGAVFVAGWLAADASPNVEGLRWYARHVLPLVRAALPDFTTFVTGAHPPLSVQSLAGDGIVLSGFVESIRSMYSGARVAIAPILVGAGVKIKTIEALQYGVPVVATAVGAEGLTTCDAFGIGVSDDPSGFAQRLIELAVDDCTWLKHRAIIEQTVPQWEHERLSWASVVEDAIRQRKLSKVKMS